MSTNGTNTSKYALVNKLSTEGEGGVKKSQTFVYVECELPPHTVQQMITIKGGMDLLKYKTFFKYIFHLFFL